MSSPDDPWFRLAPCGLISMSLGGVVTEANETFLTWTGYAAEEVVGRPFLAVLDPGSRLFFETRHLHIVHLEGAVNEVALTVMRKDGTRLPMLVNASLDLEAQLVRTALFSASERHLYETELLAARKIAESSEARVRILQDVSSAFGLSASDEDVAQSFVDVAREAFDAKAAMVMLLDDEAVLTRVAGTNPLEGLVAPVTSLRNTAHVTVVEETSAREEFPELAAAMRTQRISSLSITPLLADDRRLGILICFFGRRTEFDEHFFDLQHALGRQASQTLVRVRLQRQLAYLALHDQLTGVANRQLLQQLLDDAIDDAVRTSEPLAVLFLDIDSFKEVNDRFGHATGDAVLVELAARLRDGVRGGDVVGRMGGDEFVAICANADINAAAAIAHRILSITRAPFAVGAAEIAASVSVGVSLYTPGVDERPDGASLLVRADGAMYDSKGAGKNRVTIETIARG
ncbi:PAS domain S-box protein [Microbacterium sp. Root166]|uniref:sensor domain-containing protein n=1 Tax=Microbacterium sp. Root166 TaxID=1736478 RepID=UPI0006F8E25C|nr:diguanylate cyclase [Microbacterium sp. Root166]KQZ86074.1 PAS domain S-box protein [Microbacterium sp. Root166]